MFSGIISNTGTVTQIGLSSLTINSDNSLAGTLHIGDSVSVNGICLTIVNKSSDGFSVEFIEETKNKTNISDLKNSDQVNLELPVTPSSLLSGHIVQGHIDTTAVLEDISEQSNQKELRFKMNNDLGKYLVDKGSVTINGISLTIIEASGDKFSVGIIPHTWKNTMLNKLSFGDSVNIEVDVIAKHIDKLLKERK